MTRDNILLKLDKLMTRLLRYRRNNYHNTILKEEDRLDFGKDLKYVEHAINLLKGDSIPTFAKADIVKLNKGWKKYKPKEYVAHA